MPKTQLLKSVCLYIEADVLTPKQDDLLIFFNINNNILNYIDMEENFDRKKRSKELKTTLKKVLNLRNSPNS